MTNLWTHPLLLSSAAVFMGALVAFVVWSMRRVGAVQKNRDRLSEILACAPLGYFYFLYNTQAHVQEICSRRLAVLLGLCGTAICFDDVLDKWDKQGQALLLKAVKKLKEDGQTFHLSLQNETHTVSLDVTGTRVTNIDGELFADVLWFQDSTDLYLKQEENAAWIKALQDRDKLFSSALDELPFPVWLRNSDLTLAYCNQKNQEPTFENDTQMTPKMLAIAAKNAGQMKHAKGIMSLDGRPKMMEVYEIPLSPDEGKNSATLGFAKDIQTEEVLHQSLQTYLRAQYQVLASLSSGIAIFDADGALQFYNAAFGAMWKLDEFALSEKPSFAAILDKLREKRMLPETGNFMTYKHSEMNLFSSVTQPTENILNLPTGQILKRTVSPYPLGGVIMVFEDITDRFSLERSFNEQLAIQKSIINHTKEGIIVFDGDGRLKLYNAAYVRLFPNPKESLLHEPLLLDVLEMQKQMLCESDDVWSLLKNKILSTIEEAPDEPLTLSTQTGTTLSFKCVHLPDGGLLLSYEHV